MNQPPVTIQDIAARANVSKATVSRVLNNQAIVKPDKREAVIAAMAKLNYQPNAMARSLASGQSMTIGILTQNFGSPFYDTVNQGIIAGLAGTGYSPIFVDGQWQLEVAEAVIKTLLGRKVDGLLLVGGDVSEELLNRLKAHTPTIVIGRDLPGWDQHSIFIDNVDGGYKATRFLIEAGHRNIAHIKGIKDHQDTIRRFAGYQQALKEAGIEFDENLVFNGSFDGPSGVLAVESFLQRGANFTAIFAANDMMAFGARLALSRHGIRVPDDVSIVGYDDQAESAFVTPPLTTVRQPAAEMGQAAATAMIKLLKGESWQLPKLSTELRIRESVARRR